MNIWLILLPYSAVYPEVFWWKSNTTANCHSIILYIFLLFLSIRISKVCLVFKTKEVILVVLVDVGERWRWYRRSINNINVGSYMGFQTVFYSCCTVKNHFTIFLWINISISTTIISRRKRFWLILAHCNSIQHHWMGSKQSWLVMLVPSPISDIMYKYFLV